MDEISDRTVERRARQALASGSREAVEGALTECAARILSIRTTLVQLSRCRDELLEEGRAGADAHALAGRIRHLRARSGVLSELLIELRRHHDALINA